MRTCLSQTALWRSARTPPLRLRGRAKRAWVFEARWVHVLVWLFLAVALVLFPRFSAAGETLCLCLGVKRASTEFATGIREDGTVLRIRASGASFEGVRVPGVDEVVDRIAEMRIVGIDVGEVVYVEAERDVEAVVVVAWARALMRGGVEVALLVERPVW